MCFGSKNKSSEPLPEPAAPPAPPIDPPEEAEIGETRKEETAENHGTQNGGAKYRVRRSGKGGAITPNQTIKM